MVDNIVIEVCAAVGVATIIFLVVVAVVEVVFYFKDLRDLLRKIEKELDQ